MRDTFVDAETNTGVYHLYNVCVRLTERFPILQFFNETASIPRVIQEDHATNVWVKSEGYRLTDWPDMADEVERVWEEEEEPVYLLLPLDNPAHCLHDCMFSTAIEVFGDRPHGNDGLEEGATRSPYFQKFIYASVKSAPAAGQSWCVFMHENAGMLGASGELFRTTKTNASQLCIRHLVVPRFMRHRFAQDWSSLHDVRGFDYIETSSHYYPPYTLESLQARLFSRCFHEKVVSWDESTRRPYRYAKLLLHDRGEARRRKWGNGHEAFQWIQRRYSNEFASMEYLSQGYANLSPMQQAAVFHSADVVIAAHGGALANLIFCRPGTMIIELTDEPGPIGWYSFTTRLGMKHVACQPPSLQVHYPEAFDVTMAYLDTVVQRTLFANE